jgi:hypothetical protein
MMSALYNFFVKVIEAMGDVWLFLNTPLVVPTFELFGYEIIKGQTIYFLTPSSTLIIAIITIGLISLFRK